jgi:hypothetical protein
MGRARKGGRRGTGRLELRDGACLISAPAWAQEAFQLVKDDAYGELPAPNARGSYRLTDEYVTTATEDVSQQLSKAGVRLAFIRNRALRKP